MKTIIKFVCIYVSVAYQIAAWTVSYHLGLLMSQSQANTDTHIYTHIHKLDHNIENWTKKDRITGNYNKKRTLR